MLGTIRPLLILYRIESGVVGLINVFKVARGRAASATQPNAFKPPVRGRRIVPGHTLDAAMSDPEDHPERLAQPVTAVPVERSAC